MLNSSLPQHATAPPAVTTQVKGASQEPPAPTVVQLACAALAHAGLSGMLDGVTLGVGEFDGVTLIVGEFDGVGLRVLVDDRVPVRVAVRVGVPVALGQCA